MIEKTPIVTYSGEENPYELVNYLDQARGLLTSQFQNKDILDRYLQILIQGKDDLQIVFSDVMQERSLHNAAGKQLDVIGNIVGQERQLFDSAIIYYFGFAGAVGASPYGTIDEEESVGQWKSIDDPLLGVRELSDAEYRALIRIKIIKNTSNASTTALVDAANLLFGVDKVTYQEDEATITLNIGRDYNDVSQAKFPGLDEVTLASRFLNIPIGVQLFLQPPETLVFDFENNSYDIYEEGEEVLQPKLFSEVIDFTRGSTGTYFDSGGVLQTAAIDEPRLTHEPASGDPLGLLIEEQRTNLLLWSEAFDDAVWDKKDVAVSVDEISSPDGLLTADKIIPNTDLVSHFISRDTTVASSEAHCYGVFAKAGEYGFLQIATSLGLSLRYQNFDLINGVLASGDTSYNPSITPVGNGWYFCAIENATTISTPLRAVFAPIDSDRGRLESWTGDGTSGIYLWGAQLEEGSFPTSYIKTEGSQVTRTRDLATINNLSPWFNQVEGSFVFGFNPEPSSETLAAFLLTDGSTRRIFYRHVNSETEISSFDGSTILDASGLEMNEPNKSALTYSVEGGQLAINGESGIKKEEFSFSDFNAIDLFATQTGTISFLRFIPKPITQTELMIETLPDGVIGTEVELDLTTDPSLELNFTDNYSIIQSEE